MIINTYCEVISRILVVIFIPPVDVSGRLPLNVSAIITPMPGTSST